MLSPRLFIAQRITAIILAPLVIAHLVGIFFAIHNGLSAAEILSRTQNNFAVGIFYEAFVITVAVHAAIGVRVIVYEWLRVRGVLLGVISWVLGLSLLSMGSFAVAALVLP